MSVLESLLSQDELKRFEEVKDSKMLKEEKSAEQENNREYLESAMN